MLGDISTREKLVDAYDKTLNTVKEKEVIIGKVIGMNKREVVVNIGFKSDGIISLNEFRYNPDLKIGDEVEVYIESQEDKKGQLVLSHKKRAQPQLGQCERSARKRRNCEGLHKMPHQGRYDCRCVWYRSFPTRIAN